MFKIIFCTAIIAQILVSNSLYASDSREVEVQTSDGKIVKVKADDLYKATRQLSPGVSYLNVTKVGDVKRTENISGKYRIEERQVLYKDVYLFTNIKLQDDTGNYYPVESRYFAATQICNILGFTGYLKYENSETIPGDRARFVQQIGSSSYYYGGDRSYNKVSSLYCYTSKKISN